MAAAPTAVLPAVEVYEPLPGEVEPACKRAATAALVAALTTAPGLAPLAARLPPGQDPAPLAGLAGDLPAGAAATVDVVYPQYGGLSAARDTASVMLVVDQLVALPPAPGAPPAAPERRSRTVDARLARAGGGAWRVTEVLPAQPGAAAARVSPAVAAVLADDRVVLPAAARADLLSGLVADPVAAALTALARRWRTEVQVVRSGHPPQVWATDRTSRHVLGRAVDVRALDGAPVVAHDRAAWREALRVASAAGASELGGPAVVDLPGSFTDAVHQDHLHLGFGSPR